MVHGIFCETNQCLSSVGRHLPLKGKKKGLGQIKFMCRCKTVSLRNYLYKSELTFCPDWFSLIKSDISLWVKKEEQHVGAPVRRSEQVQHVSQQHRNSEMYLSSSSWCLIPALLQQQNEGEYSLLQQWGQEPASGHTPLSSPCGWAVTVMTWETTNHSMDCVINHPCLLCHLSLWRRRRGRREAGGGSATSMSSHPEPLSTHPPTPQPPTVPPSLPRVAPGVVCPKREWQLWSQGLQHPGLTKAALFELLPRAAAPASSPGPRTQLLLLSKGSQSEPRPASAPAQTQPYETLPNVFISLSLSSRAPHNNQSYEWPQM